MPIVCYHMPLYGRDRWDGVYIILQIVTIQSWFYFLWTFVHGIFRFLFRLRQIPIMDILFDPAVSLPRRL